MQSLSPYIRRAAEWNALYIITEEYVSVISTVGKMFARVLNERVKAQTEDKVMDEQGGFRA